MLLMQLYFYFENLLESTIINIQELNFRDLTAYKALLLGVIAYMALYAMSYSIKSFSSYCSRLVYNICNWQAIGSLGWINFILGSFNDIKFALAILILTVLGFKILFNSFVNNQNPRFQNIFEVHIDEFFFEDIDANGGANDANLNLNDNQNVHNATLSRHVIESIKKLVTKEADNNIIKKSQLQVYNEIRQYLLDCKSSSTIALDVIDTIHKSNNIHIGSNLTEMEIIRLIWQRIDHPVNDKVKNDLCDALRLQLNDCKPNGVIMCLTGRVSRILQTLECVDAEGVVDLKPMWVIKEQIAEYCGKYSDKLFKRVPIKYQQAFESLERTPEQTQLAEDYIKCLRSNLERKFTRCYVEKNILSQHQLDNLTKDYYDHLDG
jgi:hypothetical protein